MDIHYTITFFSEWHCGSGLASGANLDALVIKDVDGLPYVPGKTVKGLLREAIEALNGSDPSTTDEIFGHTDKDGEEGTTSGHAFFSNAELPRDVRNKIIAGDLARYLYRSAAATAIDEQSGTARDNSLRKMETVIPCTLEGEILNIPEHDIDAVLKGMKYIKRLGQNRNRGLGRCKFEINKGENRDGNI